MMEHPILFSGTMVRAILAGHKTQTRRVITPQPVFEEEWVEGYPAGYGDFYWDNKKYNENMDGDLRPHCPYGQPGGKLWVRETWAVMSATRHHEYGFETDGIVPLADYTKRPQSDDWVKYFPVYRADGYEACGGERWRPSIYMPRWASRLTLEIVDVRVERLQDISEEDAVSEGVVWAHEETAPQSGKFQPCARKEFKFLWNAINGKRGYGWDVNPWVWVIEFKK